MYSNCAATEAMLWPKVHISESVDFRKACISRTMATLCWPLFSPGTTAPGAADALVRSGIIRPADSSRKDNAPDVTGSNLHEGKPARPALGPDARAARCLEAGGDGIAELFARLTETHRVL